MHFDISYIFFIHDKPFPWFFLLKFRFREQYKEFTRNLFGKSITILEK